MTLNVLLSARPEACAEYKDILTQKFSDVGLDVTITSLVSDPTDVDYIVYAPNGPIQDFTTFTNVKLVQSLWAGVEVALGNKTLTQPLARMVDRGMNAGMSDYVLGHVLRHHLNTDRYSQAIAGEWLDDITAPLAADTTVGFLGIGELGMYCAHCVARHGFNVVGWSRTQKTDEIIECHSGPEGLQDVLAQSDILVLLMPDTADTRHLINAKSIDMMKDHAAIINPGRGPLIDDDALIAALNNGKLSGATLDVFTVEPLPADSPYWTHPKVLVTPHIASETRPTTASDLIVDNILRGVKGQPFLHLVDRSAGY